MALPPDRGASSFEIPLLKIPGEKNIDALKIATLMFTVVLIQH